MLNPQLLLLGLVALTYLLILGVLVTGLLLLVQKNSDSLKLIHRWAVVPAIFLWVLVHFGAILVAKKPLFAAGTFLLFLLMVFGGAFTGMRLQPGFRRAVHVGFGALTFLLFTVFIFRFLLAPA
jgi:hypothetical protein